MGSTTHTRRAAALHLIFTSWRTLRAWEPVDMRSVKLLVEPRARWDSTGLAETDRTHGQARVTVRLGEDEADGLATLLHELAHIAAQRRGCSGHDAGWRAIFRAATREVFGQDVADIRANLALTDAVADVIRQKWRLQLAAGRTVRSAEGEADAVTSDEVG